MEPRREAGIPEVRPNTDKVMYESEVGQQHQREVERHATHLGRGRIQLAEVEWGFGGIREAEGAAMGNTQGSTRSIQAAFKNVRYVEAYDRSVEVGGGESSNERGHAVLG